MSEAVTTTRQHRLHYRGRGGQIVIYLGKLLRGFVYQSDWIVLPMAALIAGVVSMVVRRDFFLTMEGTLKGSLALTCTSIWNGCFNSIQVVCRERDIIKREHRSGLHITAYIASHMVYQALLCMAQTAITLYVCRLTGIQFPSEGLITPWLMVDLGITIFLITYAADMLSLWISCLTKSTTTAMTVMPFVLIFQLVFSGGIFNLPAWATPISRFSISNFGMKCIASQSHYNELPLVTAWNSILKVEQNGMTINQEITLGQVLDFLQNDSLSTVKDLREKEVILPSTMQLMNLLGPAMDLSGIESITGLDEMLSELPEDLFSELPDSDLGAEDEPAEETVTDGQSITIGEVVDMLAADPTIQENRGQSYTINVPVTDLIEAIGRDNLQEKVETVTAKASYVADYETSKPRIIHYWEILGVFTVGFAFLSILFLEFVDKDKR